MLCSTIFTKLDLQLFFSEHHAIISIYAEERFREINLPAICHKSKARGHDEVRQAHPRHQRLERTKR